MVYDLTALKQETALSEPGVVGEAQIVRELSILVAPVLNASYFSPAERFLLDSKTQTRYYPASP